MTEEKLDKKAQEKAELKEATDANKEVLAKIEAANVESKELLEEHERQKQLASQGGQAEAGTSNPEVDKEKAIKDRVNEKLKDTGLKI